ncbi:hypothetical protein DICPUDRAFT_94046 [Dictyostelium purpureum]|uniref:Oxidation resistance protein 1 n=1 Tax=Dictyostelium purpureum TaxID=5786 RepID=F0ZEP6_DICPU|nr:uncharacterized protein DICPUDRAFT_94046 [Dictyostelium purpureum]EGC37562.1 hypothetical protein DICPUDRAFT_94046 [Dictyostelium purpureum]|eukprot:XP_003285888.1 hypothetical protein DICPUDRAFT_94046 [Dictyostelium purpureum]
MDEQKQQQIQQIQPNLTICLDKKNKYKFSKLASDINGENIAISSERNLFLLHLPTDIENDDQLRILNTLNNETVTTSLSSSSATTPSSTSTTGIFEKIKQSKDTDSNLVEWSPSRTESNLLMTSSSRENSLFLWNMKEQKTIQKFSKAHIRHITSLSWNSLNTNLVASASSDSVINLWDIRERANISSNKFRSNLSQIAWDPYSSDILATSNGGEINIVDIRKFGSPIACFSTSAHIGTMSNIQWSTKHQHELLTCNPNDKSIKVWDYKQNTKPIHYYNTGTYSSYARFVPFLENQVIASTSSNGSFNDIQLWGNDKSQPILSLTGGHKDAILDFNWRVVERNNVVSKDPKKYYLMSIGKDNQFSMWRFNSGLVHHLNDSSICENLKPLPRNLRISQDSQELIDQAINDLSDDENNQENQEQTNVNNIELSNISNNNSSNSNNNNNNGDKIDKKKNKLLDLHQELGNIIQEKFDYISFEKISYSDRICIVNVDNRKFCVIILFPTLYPSAAPTFDILFNESSLAITNIQVKLKKKLDKLSSKLIEKKSPFLYHILDLISSYYKSTKKEFPTIKNLLDSPTIQRRTPKNVNNQPMKRVSLTPNFHHPNNSNNNNNYGTPFTTSVHPNDGSNISPIVISTATATTTVNTNKVIDSFSLLNVPSISLSESPSVERNRSQSASSTINSGVKPSFDLSINSGNLGANISGTPPGRGRSGSFGGKMVEPNIVNNNILQQYIVKPTDTLSGISLQFAMPRNIIIQTNRLHSERLVAGQKLWVYKKNENEQQQQLKSSPEQSDSSSVNSSSSSVSSISNIKLLKLSKGDIVKEKLVCFMKNQKIVGHLTLTPYNLIFQSVITPTTNKPIQLFAEYQHIISCKYLSNKVEWLAHFSKDWNKEQRYIKDKINKNNNFGNKAKAKTKSKQEEDEHDAFLQKEISKLNEMEEEKTLLLDDETGVEKKVLVFPCIYAIIHKDNSIQTIFFRGSDAQSVFACFSYLKQLIVGSKIASPQTISPILSSTKSTTDITTPTTTTTTTVASTTLPPNISNPATLMAQQSQPIDIKSMLRNGSYTNIRSLDVSYDSSSYDEYVEPSPQLLKDQTKYQVQERILMTPEIYKKIRHYLPIRTQGSDIELLYNSINDGISFSTFYRKVKPAEKSIMLIKDEHGYIFGAFLSDKIECKKDFFYGSGETFLFSIKPVFAIHTWTKKNDLFMYTSHDYISIGGGSHFGLWMDNDFHHGSTGPCETFDNPHLSKDPDSFIPNVVEIWGIL